MATTTPRPVPIFYETPPLSLKRAVLAKTSTKRCISLPKPLPGRGRFSTRSKETFTRRPVFVSLAGEKNDVLANCTVFDPSSSETFFEQCFDVVKTLGVGSFGEVFGVRSKEDGSTFAIKRTLERFRSTMDRQQKLREVEKLQLVKHPNLVRLICAWEQRGLLYIQTELCEKSLEQLVLESPSNTVPEEVLWGYFSDLLEAVDYLHERNLVHGDIKPANVLVTNEGTCKLGDFGLMVDLEKDNVANFDEGDSKYLSSEVIRKVPSKSSDIFSLGISILELASGIFLPTCGTGWHMLRRKEIPDGFLKDLSPDLVAIIQQMMDSDPDARPSARQLLGHSRFLQLREDRRVLQTAPSRSPHNYRKRSSTEDNGGSPRLRIRRNRCSLEFSDGNSQQASAPVMKTPESQVGIPLTNMSLRTPSPTFHIAVRDRSGTPEVSLHRQLMARNAATMPLPPGKGGGFLRKLPKKVAKLDFSKAN